MRNLSSVLFAGFGMLIAGCGGGQSGPSEPTIFGITFEAQTTGHKIPTAPYHLTVTGEGYEGGERDLDPNGRAHLGLIPGTYTASLTVPDHCEIGGAAAKTFSFDGKVAPPEVHFAVECGWGATGHVVYTTGGSQYRLRVYDVVSGTSRNLFETPSGSAGLGYPTDPKWSRDGSRVVFALGSGVDGGDIWVIDADGNNLRALTSGTAYDMTPAWSPDGQQIVFSRKLTSNGNSQLYLINADGTNLEQLTNFVGESAQYPAWSPDGSKIVFSRGGNLVLWIVRMNDRNISQLSTATGLYMPAWSPDGSMIAYASISTSDYGVTGGIGVMGPGGNDPHLLVSKFGSFLDDPSWSPDGSYVVYRGPDPSGGTCCEGKGNFWARDLSSESVPDVNYFNLGTPEDGGDDPAWGP